MAPTSGTAAVGSTVREQLVRDILRYGAVKFGSFTLKSGAISPIYVDIRICVSHPDFLRGIAEAVEETTKSSGVECDHLCGVPYTALPIATCVSTKTHQPMLMRRKEAKSYGTKQIIEGKYTAGDRVLIIEDIVTTGSSILETVKVLEEVGLKVTDAIVLIDREQGGSDFLRERGIRLHSVLRLTEIIAQLEREGLIESAVAQEARDFISNVRPSLTASAKAAITIPKRKTFAERAKEATQPVAKRLFEITSEKKTNLCVAVDVTKSQELLSLAAALGPHICALKTHIDGIEDFVYDQVIPPLQTLASKHNFLLFEDRKFADIGATVRLQYGGGVYRIAEWAHLVTAHGLPGPGLLQGLEEAAKEAQANDKAVRGCVLVAEMSCKGALLQSGGQDHFYREACARLIENHPEFAIGAVTQSPLSSMLKGSSMNSSAFIQMTPGVKMSGGGDSLGQQYVSPRVAVAEKGADVIIVGRGITAAKDPAATAQEYAREAWIAYEEAIRFEKE